MLSLKDKVTVGFDRIKKNDLAYFEEQFMYGHREILLNYIYKNRIDFPNNSYLQAGLAHGWAPHFEIWKLRKKSLVSAPRFVWNSPHSHKQNLKYGQIPIGSPWLYMLLTLGLKPGDIAELPVTDQRINLVMPYHSEGLRIKKISDQALHYKSFLNPAETTVCLFWNDFCDPTNRSTFLNLGFKIECVGYPYRVNESYKIGSPRTFFLINLIKLMLEHRTYITDSISTSFFYAASLGKEVVVNGDKIAKEFLLNFTLPVNQLGAKDSSSGDEWLLKNQHFISLDKSKLRLNNLKSWEELGFQFILNPEELTKLPWKQSADIPEHLVEFRRKLQDIQTHLKKTSIS